MFMTGQLPQKCHFCFLDVFNFVMVQQRENHVRNQFLVRP